MSEGDGQVTQLLHAMAAGDPSAREVLLPLLYAELHRLASAYMRRERSDHTLRPTALINEAYLRLARQDTDWASRQHFVGVAAHVMRHVLVDYARAHKAEQRGGDLKRVEMNDDLAVAPMDIQKLDEIRALDLALQHLAALNPRQAKVVELRYFGGLSMEEIAAHLDLSLRSVKRDWSLARIWLFRQLRPSSTPHKETLEKWPLFRMAMHS